LLVGYPALALKGRLPVGRSQYFGSYQLVERIGVGAMGEVYRAIHRPTGRLVALKRLMASASGNAEAILSLRQEATLLRALDHPGIAKVVEVGEVDGVHFIAYEFIWGRDLRAIQDRAMGRGLSPASRRTPLSRPGLDAPPSSRHEPIPLDVALHVALRVAEALAHAHERVDAEGKPLALVHRDVSPPNVIVAFDGSVKLLDFGIARAAGLLVRTDAGQVKGTIGYMSPEQVRGGPIDARSDLYSLGVCLWELCTGRRLFDALLPHEVARRILSGDIPAPRAAGAKISPELEAVILKALAQSTEGRYPTAAELHAALSRQAGADGLLTDSVRVARYVRSLFPEAAAEEAASREESLDMADNKGGSDLDVFEGLAKKGQRPASPGLTPPPPSQARKATLLGGLGPLPPPVAPPPSSKSAPPPPAPPAPPPPPPAPSVPGPQGDSPRWSRSAPAPGRAPAEQQVGAAAARAAGSPPAAPFREGAVAPAAGRAPAAEDVGHPAGPRRAASSAAPAVEGGAAASSAGVRRRASASAAHAFGCRRAASAAAGAASAREDGVVLHRRGGPAAAVPARAQRGGSAPSARAAADGEDAAAAAARAAPSAGRSAEGEGRRQGRGRHGLGRRGGVDARLRQGGARRAPHADQASGQGGRGRRAPRQLGRRRPRGEGALRRAAAGRARGPRAAAGPGRRAP
jgi:serine/threonine-protein kinase